MNPEPISTITDDNLGDITIEYGPDSDAPVSAPVESSAPSGEGGTTNSTESAAVTTPEDTTPPVETPPPPTNVITIDKTKLRDELRRLEREDPEFANQYNIHVGDKAARKYKPVIDTLTAERDAARRELRKREMLATPDAEKARLFETNPQWAREYADLVHSNPADLINAAQAQTEKSTIESRIQDTFRGALDRGLPQEQVQAVLADVQAGKYDRDEDGRMLHPLEALTNLQQVLTDRLLEHARNGARTPAAVAPAPATQEPVATAPNPALVNPGPDTSVTGVVRNVGHRDPVVDYQKALKEGKELSSDEIDKITARYLTME